MKVTFGSVKFHYAMVHLDNIVISSDMPITQIWYGK